MAKQTSAERLAYHREYNRKNRDKLRQQNAAWREAHKEELRAYLAAYRIKYDAEHADEIRARKAAYCRNNPEKISARHARYYTANKEKIAAYHGEWFQVNKDRIGAAHAAYNAAHAEEIKAQKAAYYLANKERILATHAEYRLKNPGRASMDSAIRRAQKANAPINDLTAAQWREIKAAYGQRCVYCGRKMKRLTMDHIQPLVKGGSHTASNIAPACRACNLKKHKGPPLCPVQPLLLTVAPARKKAQ